MDVIQTAYNDVDYHTLYIVAQWLLYADEQTDDSNCVKHTSFHSSFKSRNEHHQIDHRRQFPTVSLRNRSKSKDNRSRNSKCEMYNRTGEMKWSQLRITTRRPLYTSLMEIRSNNFQFVKGAPVTRRCIMRICECTMYT